MPEGQQRRQDARHLQPSDRARLGGRRAEAAPSRPTAASTRCSAPARLLALLAVLCQHGRQHLLRRAALPILSKSLPNRAAPLPAEISPTGATEHPHRNRRTCRHLQHHVGGARAVSFEDLKRAAEENRALFMGSIQMLAGAVDEKDPYTRGHSDRVTRYSLLIAREMKLDDDFIEILRVSAQLA